jgi:GNAT superfamily N-acetyltransferase
MLVYVAIDGDHIGRKVGQMSLADDEEGIRRISQAIDLGNQIWASWVNSVLGEMISFGGDEARFKVPADKLDALDAIRRKYAHKVGATVSVGVGMRLSEADRALLAAKLRGGDQIVLYTPEVEQILKQLEEKNEGQKIKEEYLTKADPPESPEPESTAPENNASAGGGYTPIHGQGEGGAPQPPMQEASEHSQGEAMQSLADNTSAPEGTHAADDFEDELHAKAQEEDQKDSDESKQVDAKEQARQKVVQILAQVRQYAPQFAQLQQAAPELYQATQGLVAALLLTARGLVEENKSDSEKVVDEKGQDDDGGNAPPAETKKFEVNLDEVPLLKVEPPGMTAPPKPAMAPAVPAPTQLHNTVEGFMGGLKALPKEGPSRGKFITAHMNHGPFLSALQAHPQGPQVHKMLTTHLNSVANAGVKPGATQVTAKSEDDEDAPALEKVSLTPDSTASRMRPHEPRGSETFERVETYDAGVNPYDKKSPMFHHVYYHEPYGTGSGYRSVMHVLSNDPKPLGGVWASSASGLNDVQKYRADSYHNGKHNNLPWQDGQFVQHGETASSPPGAGLGTLLYTNMAKIHGRMASDSGTSKGANAVWEKLVKDPQFKGQLGYEPGNLHWVEHNGPKPTPISVIEGDGRPLNAQLSEPVNPYSTEIRPFENYMEVHVNHKSGKDAGVIGLYVDHKNKKLVSKPPHRGGLNHFPFEHADKGARGVAIKAASKATGYPYAGEIWDESELGKSEALIKAPYDSDSWTPAAQRDYTENQRGYRPEWHKGVEQIGQDQYLHEYVSPNAPNHHTFHVTTTPQPLHENYRPIAGYFGAWDVDGGGLNIDTTVVHPDHQRQGLATKVYKHLARKYGTLHSGGEQTPEAKSVWDSLAADPELDVKLGAPKTPQQHTMSFKKSEGCKHFYGKGTKCLKCKEEKGAELEKGKLPLPEHAPKHNHLNLPVGASKDGKVKIEHEDGKAGWVSVRAGQVLSNDNHPISSRNPGGR